MEEIISSIKRNQLFNGTNDEDIKKVLKEINYSIKIYSKNEIIAQEEEECKSLALILDGIIEIQRIYSNGKYIILKRLKNGDVFGEALIFSKVHLYPATVVSVQESKVLFIDKKDILKLCTTEEKILENFIALLSDKVFILNSKIKSISFKSVRQKVINFILEEVREQKGNTIYLKESKESIAAALGIPRPSLSRELINLRDMEYISFDRKTITILDIKSLEEELFD